MTGPESERPRPRKFQFGLILSQIVRLIVGPFLSSQWFSCVSCAVKREPQNCTNNFKAKKKKRTEFKITKLAKELPASASIVESPPSFATFFPFGRPPAPPHQSAPVGGPATTMDLTTAYRYNQNMMEYYTCKSECQSYAKMLYPSPLPVICAKTNDGLRRNRN